MFIRGSKSTNVKSIPAKKAICPNCQSKDTLNYDLVCNYFHIYWIPLFTYSKGGMLTCTSCNNVANPYNLSKEVRAEFQQAKKSIWPPIWHFSGIVVFSLLFYFVIKSGEAQQKNNPIYIASPAIGDIYKYEVAPREYSTMKVIDIRQDTLDFIHNEYTIKRKSKIYKIDKEKNYSKEIMFTFTIADLQEMYKDKTIFEVNRD